jgi:hypothetical protein
MTDFTARELIDTILRSLAATRASFKKPAPAPPPAGDHVERETQEEHRSVDEAADLESR